MKIAAFRSDGSTSTLIEFDSWALTNHVRQIAGCLLSESLGLATNQPGGTFTQTRRLGHRELTPSSFTPLLSHALFLYEIAKVAISEARTGRCWIIRTPDFRDQIAEALKAFQTLVDQLPRHLLEDEPAFFAHKWGEQGQRLADGLSSLWDPN